MLNDIEICKSELADSAEILYLQKLAYKSEAELNNDFTIQPLVQTIEELVAEYQKGVVLKAVLNNKIIGSVRAYKNDDTAFVGKLIVHPEHQGKGLGKRLLAAIESEFPGMRFELFTSAKSERNLHIYQNAGYIRFNEKTTDSGVVIVYLEKSNDFHFFKNNADLINLYDALIHRLNENMNYSIKKRNNYKTMIVFCNRRNFAYISLLNTDGTFINKGFKIVFNINRIINDSRVRAVTEPHPGRFSHHVIIETMSDINEQLIEWLQQASENAR